MVRRTQEIDILVGSKIREMRISKGLSRKQLSELIECSGQQLQKYEIGIDRVSVSRLYKIAKALNQPFSYFIEESQSNIPSTYERLCMEMVKNFNNIKSRRMREALNNLARDMAHGQ